MNKTAIKNFAIWARNKLIADIVYQAGLLGITEKGIANALPQSNREIQFFDIGTKDYMTVRGNAIRQRDAFVAAIKAKETDSDYVSAFRFVVEKVAYTWFNRLIAIRFMEVNDYLPSRVRVLSSENPGKAEPDMVTRPFDTDMSFSAREQDEIMRMKDENKLDELFRILFIKQCQKLSEVLPRLFESQGIERADSYLELLLTISFTDKDGVLWHLTHDISEEDFNIEREGQVEIIGWMYQYYNTEPKDRVFANLKKNIKISKDNIPAATQLFTPDWIVRYMVENSLGRLWIEGHPNDALKKSWKYYIEEVEQEPEVESQLAEIRKQYANLRLENLKAIDPCMGSGHILVCLFDVLLQIYESQGWTQREAVQSIVRNNLYGLDIDDRAAQLAYFAVMMKARQYDRRFLEREVVPHVYGIQESNDVNRDQIRLFGKGLSSLEKNNAENQLNEMLDALRNAKEYGSILVAPELDWDLLKRFTADVDDTTQLTLDTVGVDDTLIKVRSLVEQVQIMAQKYDVVVTNPPYMGARSMSDSTADFVKIYYPDAKSDLFACFISRGFDMSLPTGFVSMITMESWMFLSSFETMRKSIVNSKNIRNMVHMPYLGKGGTSLGINFGTAAVVFENRKIRNYKAQYDYVAYYETDENGVPFQFPVINDRYKTASLDSFALIPGAPIAYWVSKNFANAFQSGISVDTIGDFTGAQHKTADNDKYLRTHWEVKAKDLGSRWIYYAKGGDFRKWYGNIDLVVDWSEEAKTFYAKNTTSNMIKQKYWFKDGITYTSLTSAAANGFRYLPPYGVFDIKGPSIVNMNELEYCLGFFNTKIAQAYFRLLNPTITLQVKDVKNTPILIDKSIHDDVVALVTDCIQAAKEDWNESETSWDFAKHPLIRKSSSIEKIYKEWANERNIRFALVKSNEERINDLFIGAYGLQGEMTPDVTEEEITLHKPNLADDIKGLISYAVGCLFGRFSLDAEGLVYAGGNWDEKKYISFVPDEDNCIPITDEPYFEDDIVGRFVEFIRIVYGVESLEENLTFIAKALGNKGNSSRETIRNYFINDFFKDHCTSYSVTGSGKRPIYWLFDSGKQNGFKALVYMHRWSADTVGNLRVEYLHRMQRVYEKEIERMQDIMDNSRDNREVNQASKRREKLVKQLKEARDYDAKIAHAALSRVEIDLDDGVKVNYEKVQKGPDGKSLEILAKI